MSLTLTLNEKEAALRSTVAIPTVENWKFLSKTKKEKAIVAKKANAILLSVLEKCKAGAFKTLGDIAEDLYSQIDELADEHPDAGLSDSEADITIATFFALNYDFRKYDFFRYRGAAEESNLTRRTS